MDDTRVRTGGRRREPFALDQQHSRPSLREERGRRSADYPAPDDDDVGAVHLDVDEGQRWANWAHDRLILPDGADHLGLGGERLGSGLRRSDPVPFRLTPRVKLW